MKTPQRKQRLGFVCVVCLFCILYTAVFLVQHRARTLPLHEFEMAGVPAQEQWEALYPNAIRTLVIDTPATLLPPYLKHPGIVLAKKVTVPEAMWVVGTDIEILGAPRDILHHLNLTSPGIRSPFCPQDASLNGLILAFGQESRTGFFPVGYGYPLAQSTITSSVMFHNPHKEAYPGAVVRLTLWYIPRTKTALKELQPFFLSEQGACEGGSYSVLPGENKEVHLPADYLFTASGTAMVLGGHVHAYGKDLTLLVNGSARHTFTPRYTQDGSLDTIPLSYPKDFFLRPGDRLNFSAHYHNTSDTPIDAMSQIFFFISTPAL